MNQTKKTEGISWYHKLNLNLKIHFAQSEKNFELSSLRKGKKAEHKFIFSNVNQAVAPMEVMAMIIN